MTVTTEYGTWCPKVDRLSATLAQSVSDAFGTEGSDGYDFHAIVEEYREAINEALPDNVSLSGDIFYGPYYPEDQDFEGYPKDKFGALDIKQIVEDIDLWEIIQRNETSSR